MRWTGFIVALWVVLAGCGDDGVSMDTGVPTPPADAGQEPSDAGVPPDMGQRDVGPLDSGPSDSGFQDSAIEDTGRRDTGEPDDAGVVPDAGGADGGTLDAELTDTGVEDASLPCPIGIDDTFEATLRVSADDDRRVFVNEAMVDDFVPSRTWGTITTVQVSLFRHPSRANVVAVHAENYVEIDGLDRGVLLDVVPTSTTISTLITDASWRVSSATVADFQMVGFDDSAWAFATEEVMHPGGVYGALFGASNAWWIWLYDAAIPASQKPALETMLARRRFYVHMNGQISTAPGSCP